MKAAAWFVDFAATQNATRITMILSDTDIKREIEKGALIVDPFDHRDIQPSSIDLHLGGKFQVFHNSRYPYIDVKQPMDDLTEMVKITANKPFILHPGEFVLGCTIENVVLPDYLVARLEGKSSLGRLGLLIHSTAGYVDPGWSGKLTLELSNVANLPITLYYGMKIGQISFVRLSSPASLPYGSKELGSKYHGQTGPTPSRSYKDFQR
jgi:dCTP deaminase